MTPEELAEINGLLSEYHSLDEPAAVAHELAYRCGDLLREVTRLRGEVEELLGWLVDGLGYPFNGPMWTLPRFPERQQRRLAEMWRAKDGREDETVDDYVWACEMEGGWRMSDAELVAREAALRAELRGEP